MYVHEPVLLNEVLDALKLHLGSTVIDCTVGGGGHAKAILERIGPTGKVLGIDRDEVAIDATNNFLRNDVETGRLTLAHGSFADLESIAREKGFYAVDGILFDLGASSHHFDTPERGFSFTNDGPLDMRYDTSTGKTAADIVNHTKEKELIAIFRKYGEERLAGRITDAIALARRTAPMTRTAELARIIEEVYRKTGVHDHHIHPATRVFQALRIAVNDEFGTIERALPQALQLLKSGGPASSSASQGGRLAIITFHSIEDHIIKDFFRKEARECLCPKEFPVCRCGHTPQCTIVTKKGIHPFAEELKKNPRSRSATLRVVEKK